MPAIDWTPEAPYLRFYISIATIFFLSHVLDDVRVPCRAERCHKRGGQFCKETPGQCIARCIDAGWAKERATPAPDADTRIPHATAGHALRCAILQPGSSTATDHMSNPHICAFYTRSYSLGVNCRTPGL